MLAEVGPVIGVVGLNRQEPNCAAMEFTEEFRVPNSSDGNCFALVCKRLSHGCLSCCGRCCSCCSDECLKLLIYSTYQASLVGETECMSMYSSYEP